MVNRIILTAPVHEIARQIERARLQGIACALAEVAGPQMEPDVAIYALKNLGFTVADLKKAGADDYDLNILREADT